MPITLGSNIASLMAQRQLGKTADGLSKTYERLASGMRINRASDDAAGLAIAQSLEASRRVFAQGVRNLNDGISALTIAEGATRELTGIVTRISELATQAANGTLGVKQREALDNEAQALSEEYFRISRTTEFNGQKLFDGSIQQLSLQAGAGANSSITSTLGGVMGNGSVSTTPEQVAGGPAYATTLGDLNGDGILDLVTAEAFATVRLGVGNGTFGAATSYQTSGYSRSAVLGDLNGDGVLDLITAGESSTMNGYAIVRLGAGNGTFGAATSYQTESWFSTSAALGDLNGDGILDLITTGESGTTGGFATVRLGAGNGTFGAATSYQTESSYSATAALEDLNQDGILDLVTTGYAYPEESAAITIRLGAGDGTFRAAVSYLVGDYGWRHTAAALGDLNQDGILDLVTADYDQTGDASSYISIRLGTGNGTLSAAVSFVAADAYSTNLGDFNRDGVLDLVAGDGASAKIMLGGTRAGVAPLLPLSLKSVTDAKWTMSLMEQKLEQLSRQSSVIGAFQSRVEVATRTLQSIIENYIAAESRIKDADVAEEAANMVRQQILQQAAAAILGQANQAPNLVLQLLG